MGPAHQARPFSTPGQRRLICTDSSALKTSRHPCTETPYYLTMTASRGVRHGPAPGVRTPVIPLLQLIAARRSAAAAAAPSTLWMALPATATAATARWSATIAVSSTPLAIENETFAVSPWRSKVTMESRIADPTRDSPIIAQAARTCPHAVWTCCKSTHPQRR